MTGPNKAHESISGMPVLAPERLVPPEDFFGAHRSTLWRYACSLTASPSAAEDLVQDTLERAWRKRSNLASKKDALAWMMTVLKNSFIDVVRAEKTESNKKASYLHVVVTEKEDENLVPRWRQVGSDQLKSAILSLPKEYRDVLQCKIRGLSYDEMALELKIPKTTIGTRLFRARKALKTALEIQLDAEAQP